MESSTASKVNVALTLRAPTDTICIFSCVREDTFEEDMMAVHATKPFGLGTVDALIRFNASDDLGLGQAKRIVSCNMCVGPSSVPESLLARASPTTSLVSRKNLQVTARANRSFCWTFSSRIFCHISGGRRLKRFSFLAFSFSHKLNNSFFARAFPFPFALANKRTSSSFLRTRGSSSSLASSTLARFAEGSPAPPAIPSIRRRLPSFPSWSGLASLVSSLSGLRRYFFSVSRSELRFLSLFLDPPKLFSWFFRPVGMGGLCGETRRQKKRGRSPRERGKALGAAKTASRVRSALPPW